MGLMPQPKTQFKNLLKKNKIPKVETGINYSQQTSKDSTTAGERERAGLGVKCGEGVGEVGKMRGVKQSLNRQNCPSHQKFMSF